MSMANGGSSGLWPVASCWAVSMARLPQGDHVTPDAGLVTLPYGQEGKKATHAPPTHPVHVLEAASAPHEAWEESRWEPTFTERLVPPHMVLTHLDWTQVWELP